MFNNRAARKTSFIFFFTFVNLIFGCDIVRASGALSLMGYLWRWARIICERDFYTPSPATLRDKTVPPYIQISEGAIEIGDRKEN